VSQPADVLVVGAGPTGLTLALQAHAHGAQVRVVERRREVFRPSRALMLHPRTLEVLRPLGVTEALLAHADIAPQVRLRLGSRGIDIRMGGLALPDTAFPDLSLIRQMDVETALLDALREQGIAVERGVELVDVYDPGDSARVTLRSRAGFEQTEFASVAGCDGPESTVRRMAGIQWRGGSYREDVVLADVELDSDLATGLSRVVVARHGVLFVFALGERATWRLLATVPATGAPLPVGEPGPPVPRTQLQALVDDAGLHTRITDVAWSARFRLQHRIASRFRQGRLFLAGDAAHAFSPATGQGMNTGIQDAINLGWKLGFASAGGGHPDLLDSYALERRPVARYVLTLTHLAYALEASTSPLPVLLRGAFAPLAASAVPLLLQRRRLVANLVRLVSQLRVAYPHSPLSIEGTPRLHAGPRPGHRVPDETVICSGQRLRLHALLATPGVHVLLQRDADHLERMAFGPYVTVRRLNNWQGKGLIVVRPDGYIGYRCQVACVAQLHAWLKRIGAVRNVDTVQ
jgi:2-polyprenyl-6-methoxyphenol hydroxylase-like FAD-dependent oxidoreductase